MSTYPEHAPLDDAPDNASAYEAHDSTCSCDGCAEAYEADPDDEHATALPPFAPAVTTHPMSIVWGLLMQRMEIETDLAPGIVPAKSGRKQ